MAVSRKVEREMIRELFLNKIKMYMIDDEDVDEVLQVKSNEVAIPVVGCEGNEDFVVITVKVPTGANKGTEPYDGYEMAEDYQMKLDEKERKAKEKEEKKKRKIARDEEIRKKKKEIAEKGEQQFVLFFRRTYVRGRPIPNCQTIANINLRVDKSNIICYNVTTVKERK